MAYCNNKFNNYCKRGRADGEPVDAHVAETAVFLRVEPKIFILICFHDILIIDILFNLNLLNLLALPLRASPVLL